MAAAKKGNLWGYIDTKGNWVIQPKYQDAYNFSSSGTARITLNNELFLIDTHGNVQQKIEMKHEEEEGERKRVH
jgi:hypothetical protein